MKFSESIPTDNDGRTEAEPIYYQLKGVALDYYKTLAELKQDEEIIIMPESAKNVSAVTEAINFLVKDKPLPRTLQARQIVNRAKLVLEWQGETVNGVRKKKLNTALLNLTKEGQNFISKAGGRGKSYDIKKRPVPYKTDAYPRQNIFNLVNMLIEMKIDPKKIPEYQIHWLLSQNYSRTTVTVTGTYNKLRATHFSPNITEEM